MESADFPHFQPVGNKKNPENRILFLFQFAENKVGGSVNHKIKKVWPYGDPITQRSDFLNPFQCCLSLLESEYFLHVLRHKYLTCGDPTSSPDSTRNQAAVCSKKTCILYHKTQIESNLKQNAHICKYRDSGK